MTLAGGLESPNGTTAITVARSSWNPGLGKRPRIAR